MVAPTKRLLPLALIFSILLGYFSLSATKAQVLRMYLYKNYVIHSALNQNMVVGVDNNGHTDETNIQLWEQNGTATQAFHMVPVDGCNTAYVNTSSANLNLRSAPSTSASILATLSKGTVVEIVTVDKNG